MNLNARSGTASAGAESEQSTVEQSRINSNFNSINACARHRQCTCRGYSTRGAAGLVASVSVSDVDLLSGAATGGSLEHGKVSRQKKKY